MSDLKFCPDCGAKLVPGDRFCGDCGFDAASLAAPPAGQPSAAPPAATQVANQPTVTPSASAPPNNQPFVAPPQPPAGQPLQAAPGHIAAQPFTPGARPTANNNTAAIGVKGGGNKNALLIMISLLAVLFIGGGGIYWWLSQKEDPGAKTNLPAASQNQPQNNQSTTPNAQNVPATAQVDLTRAATYLSKPGLKCTFFVNYPDGTSGIVNRISGRAVPNEVVRVSEVEVGIDRGEEFGFGFHYVERPDGTYYILDNTPFEIFPVLKNNLTVGQTWNYEDESGIITWKVLDMGVDLDLGFAKFDDCIMMQENNQMVQFQSITYYAPGRGSVLVIDPAGTTQYYKLTAVETIDASQAADTIIKWCPNYKDIKDDRTQQY